MKVRVERDNLADAVAWAARALPARPPIPTLAGLKLTAGEGQLTAAGFNMDSSSQATVAAEIDEPGDLLVSGRLLADISRSLPNQPVVIATEGQRAELTCGRSSFMLPTLPADEFPELPELPRPIGTIPGSLFASAVASVAVASGRDDTLPMLQGIRIEMSGDHVSLAATDRYRLAVREFQWRPAQTGIEAAALIPARTLADAAKQLAGSGEIVVAFDADRSGPGDGLIGFSASGRSMTTRLIDGEFPKYRQLFPDESIASAQVDAAAMADALKRVSLVAERNASVRMRFGSDFVEIHAGSGEDANADETIECVLQGDELEIAFNPQYLLDGIGAVGSTVVELSFTGSTRPAVLAPPSQGGHPDYRYLLMPVRL